MLERLVCRVRHDPPHLRHLLHHRRPVVHPPRRAARGALHRLLPHKQVQETVRSRLAKMELCFDLFYVADSSLPETITRLKSFKHATLAQFGPVVSLPKKRYIVVAESAESTLETEMQRRLAFGTAITQDELIKVAYALVTAVSVLHRRGISGISIDPSSVLWPCKLSRFFSFSSEWGLKYSPPESRDPDFQPSAQSDVWGVGALLCECLQVETTDAPKTLKNKVSSQLIDFITKCLQPFPRPSCASLCQHPMFHDTALPLPRNNDIDQCFYSWRQSKGLSTARELELYCIAAGIIPYTPVVCLIPFALKPGQVISTPEIQALQVHKVAFYLPAPSDTASSSSGTAKVPSNPRSDKSGSSTIEEPTTESSSRYYRSILKAARRYPVGAASLYKLCNSRGIPETLRPLVWRKLLDVDEDDGGYYNFLEECKISQPIQRQLAVDIQRCHQYLPFLSSPYGKARLERILQLWLWSNPQVSYYQGFDSVCAVFVVVFAESESLAFNCFSEMMRKYLYSVQGSALSETLRVFRNLLHFLDPVLGFTLTQQKIGPDLYALPWLLTLFAHVFSMDKVCSLWDVLLLKTSVYPFFVSAAMLSVYRTELLKLPPEALLRELQSLPHKADMSKVINEADRFYQSTPYSVTQPCYDITPQLLQNTYAPFVTVHDANTSKQGAIFIDVRPKDQFLQSHYPNSINVPVRITGENQGFPSLKLTESQVQAVKKAAQGKMILVVGDQSLVANSFANILIKLKTPQVAMLQGGYQPM
mmetsp:Transcript_6489/g.11349  ORF Transcript_6489/g.11349 Transcript_6489/m.11349 type:complete len:761 (-) Transcript_6489:2527-4809(-)